MADDLNRDGLEREIKGMGKEAEGKVRNAAGGLTGDLSEQLKGKGQEIEGKTQQKVGQKEQQPDR